MSFDSHWQRLKETNPQLSTSDTIKMGIPAFKKALQRAYAAGADDRKSAEAFASIGSGERNGDEGIGGLFKDIFGFKLFVLAGIAIAVLTSPAPAGSTPTNISRNTPAHPPGENVYIVSVYGNGGYIHASSARILSWKPKDRNCTVWYCTQRQGESATVLKTDVMGEPEFKAMMKRIEHNPAKPYTILGVPISPLDPKDLSDSD